MNFKLFNVVIIEHYTGIENHRTVSVLESFNLTDHNSFLGQLTLETERLLTLSSFYIYRSILYFLCKKIEF